MRKTLFLFVFLVLLPCPQIWAETIYLKSGEILQGKIVEKGSYYTIIQVGRIPQKIYNEKIERIEEDKEASASGLRISATQFENISQEKTDLIVHLMEANGTVASMKEKLGVSLDQVPLKDRKTFERILDINGIVSQLIPVFDKYYSEEELVVLIEFYESSAGKKLMEVTPALLQDVMQATIKYFQKQQDLLLQQ